MRRNIPDRPEPIIDTGLVWIASKTFNAGNLRYPRGVSIDEGTALAFPRFDELRNGGYLKQVPAFSVNPDVKPIELAPSVASDQHSPVIPMLAAPQATLTAQLAASIKMTQELNGCSEQRAREAIAYDSGDAGRLWTRAAAAAAEDHKRKHPNTLGPSKPNVLIC